ncbi:MAG: CDP-diacylglycerol--glycerol-3-phosphate 3-phosphatidyltransferase [Clostridia bacterium]|nr:CDP-diacylglycerol--glycerol-3-phosphate 3-phosphatidyltransferase [Clostridia bacterium]
MSSDKKKEKEKETEPVIDKDSRKYKFYSGNGGMNFPNRLTIVRVILIPIFILFYFVPFAGHYFVALAVFIISTLTDMADGRIARKYSLITDFGKLLDPIADKVLVLSAFVCFIADTNIFYSNSSFGSWGIILAGIGVVLIIAREIMVAGIRLVAADKGVAIAADWFGKVKTVTQYISIFVMLFGTGFMNVASGSGTAVYKAGLYFDYLGFAVLMLSVVFTIISGVNYVIRNLDVFRAPEKAGEAAAAAAAAGAPLEEPVKPYMRPALCLLSSGAADSNGQSLKDILESAKFANIKPGTLTVALGTTEAGEPICPNLSNLQHVLIAGDAEGIRGAVNSMITSLVYRLGPRELELVLISGPACDLSIYSGLPHLHGSIISAPEDAIGAMQELSRLEDERLAMFMELKDRKNIEEYNKLCAGSGKERLPHIAVVISDLSVLMQASASLTESFIMTVLHTARACGIHFIICTTDASTAGIPAAVKASISTRIAFRTATEEGSAYILDRTGAEALTGTDMLYKGNSVADPVLLHGCSVSAEEVKAVVSAVCTGNR